MTEADANKLLAKIFLGIAVLGSFSGYKVYKDYYLFNKEYPSLASSSFTNTDAGKSNVVFRLVVRGQEKCIGLYDSSNDRYTLNQLPIAQQMGLLEAKRHDIDLNLQQMGIPKPQKVPLCYNPNKLYY